MEGNLRLWKYNNRSWNITPKGSNPIMFMLSKRDCQRHEIQAWTRKNRKHNEGIQFLVEHEK